MKAEEVLLLEEESLDWGSARFIWLLVEATTMPPLASWWPRGS
jgi:hypothetical protein